MKLRLITAALACAFIAEGALGACSNPARQVKGADLDTLLRGHTVCSSRGGDRWQEQHRADGTLWDYKRGPTDKVDPTKQVGTWSVSGSGANTAVTHSYGAGGSHTFEVWDNGGGSYSFCKGNALEMDFTIQPGTGGGCP